MFKGIIFDLDGTLIDSMSVWKNIGNDFLISQGKVPEENLNQSLKDMNLNQSSQYFIDKYNIELTVEEIINNINKLVEAKYRECIQLKPYAKEILEYLQGKNIKMCVATESDKKIAKPTLQKLGIIDYFDFIITSGEVGIGKSNPKIFIESANRLSLNNNEIIVVEDSSYSVKTAKSAGFYTVGIFDEMADVNKSEIMSISDRYINSLEEMKNIL